MSCDDSHVNAYGAYELAKFDPSRPDPVREWSLPLSPMRPMPPEGR